MKKMISLLLCLLLLAGLFAGGAAAETEAEPAESEETAQAEEAEENADLTAEVGAQAFAVTMTVWLGGFDEDSDLSDPLFLWDAAGWYAAWLYRTESCDLMRREDIVDFIASLGADEVPEIPEGWEEYGVMRVLRSSDGGEVYDFEQHKLEIDEMLGVSMMVSFLESGGNSILTDLTCYFENGLSGDWLYEIDFEENGEESAFPCRMTAFRVLDEGPKMEGDFDFTWDELLAANRLENILSIYPAVKISDPEYPENGTWLLSRNGNYARVSVWEDKISGEICGCYFDCEETESGETRAVIGLIDETAGNPELLENYISSMLDNVCVVQMEGIEDDLIRLVCTYRFGYQQWVAVDRGTLVLRELEYRFDETVPPSVTCLEYRENPPDFGFLDGWDGELRTVTSVWEDALFNE